MKELVCIVFIFLFYSGFSFALAQTELNIVCTTSANTKPVFEIYGLKLKPHQFYSLKLKRSQIDSITGYFINSRLSSHQGDTLVNVYYINSLIALNNRILYTPEDKRILKTLSADKILYISNLKKKVNSKKIRVMNVVTKPPAVSGL